MTKTIVAIESIEKAFAEEIKNNQPIKGFAKMVFEGHAIIRFIKSGFEYKGVLNKKDVKKDGYVGDLRDLIKKGDAVLFKIINCKQETTKEVAFVETKEYYNLLQANESLRGKDYAQDISAEQAVNSIKDLIEKTLGDLTEPAEAKMMHLMNEIGLVTFIQIMNEEIKGIDTDPTLTLINMIEKSSKERGCL